MLSHARSTMSRCTATRAGSSTPAERGASGAIPRSGGSSTACGASAMSSRACVPRTAGRSGPGTDQKPFRGRRGTGSPTTPTPSDRGMTTHHPPTEHFHPHARRSAPTGAAGRGAPSDRSMPDWGQARDGRTMIHEPRIVNQGRMTQPASLEVTASSNRSATWSPSVNSTPASIQAWRSGTAKPPGRATRAARCAQRRLPPGCSRRP